MTAPLNLARLTLPILLAEWARIVDRLEHQPHDPAHVFADDVLVRHEISARLRAKPSPQDTRDMLHEFDRHFRALTEERGACVFGEAAAVASGWTPSREWYFWRAPRR